MPTHDGNHRAELDREGNIILPGMGIMQPKSAPQEKDQKPNFVMSHEMGLEMELPTLSLPELHFAEAERTDAVSEFFAVEEEETREEPRAHAQEMPSAWQDDVSLGSSETMEYLAQILRTTQPKEQPKVFNAADAVRKRVVNLKLPTVPMPDWSEMRQRVVITSEEWMKEGSKQVQTTLVSGAVTGREIARGSRSAAGRFWRFLAQPVWVPGRRSIPKKRSRGMLFVTDVVRFGGTFASLFAVLFLSLNYQSFWEIVQARLDPLSQTQAQDLIKQEMADSLTNKLKRVPNLATAGASDGDLLALLPDVGPPENRLIIPKLDLNVPIMVPSNDALMREDWKALEDVIQSGLQNGVVHYPGTAKPGQAGNFFLTGHSSYFPWDPGKYKSVFARLSVLNPGDEYWVFYGGDKHRYIVQERKEVKPNDVTVLDQPIDERISTLMTCTPVGTALRRLIIRAQEVDIDTGQPLKVGEHEKQSLPQQKLEVLPI